MNNFTCLLPFANKVDELAIDVLKEASLVVHEQITSVIVIGIERDFELKFWIYFSSIKIYRINVSLTSQSHHWIFARSDHFHNSADQIALSVLIEFCLKTEPIANIQPWVVQKVVAQVKWKVAHGWTVDQPFLLVQFESVRNE
jgi:hypothetical protein